MPLLIGVLSVLALIAVVAVCRRLIGSRADEHAMESYEHALDVLGDASRRSESQRVRILPHEEVARPHFHATDAATTPVPRPGAAADVPPPRVRLEPPVLPGVSPAVPEPEAGVAAAEAAGAALTFDDVHSGPVTPARHGSRGPRRDRARPHPDPRRTRRLRQGATGGLAVVAAGAVAVAALQLSAGPAKRHATSGTVANHGSRSTATTPGGSGSPTSTSSVPRASTTTTSVPSAIVPQASSATDVSYRAPAPRYTLTFQASAPCWIGIQQTTGGPWVWEETVQAGQSPTYSASGSIIVRLGAPRVIRVSVDGVTVQLPPSNVQPYDLTFTPNS